MSLVPSVWAPHAKNLVIDTGDGRHTMARDEGGWWHAQEALAHGHDYYFYVDGRGPYPDPRSAWQPAGVHGASRILDHARHKWRDAGQKISTWRNAVVYELHVGTFSPQGTFEGVGAHLDHLQELGATHIELMPVAAFSGKRGWGYDGVSLFAPHTDYGGPSGLKRLVDACHCRGLGVLLDVVYNHLGPDGNMLGKFGPYFTDRYQTPWGDAVNFDGPDSDEVRRFFIDNARMWINDYHVDGLRIDAVHAIVDTSATHFLEALGENLHGMRTACNQSPVVIIESDRNDPRPIHETSRGGYGLDGLWNEDFHHALHVCLTGERQGYYQDYTGVDDIAKALMHGFVHEGDYSKYRCRAHGRSADVMPERLVGFLQNHDQVGNRAAGERIGMLAGLARQRAAAALVLLSPFVPLIFQGEEWAASTNFPYFTDFADPELADRVRQGRRAEFEPFGWRPEEVPDPQAPETFRSAKLHWDERHQPVHAEMLDWYQRLLVLRKEMLAHGALKQWPAVRADREQHCLIVDHGALLVACNLDDAGHDIVLPEARKLNLREASGSVVERSGAVHLPADCVAIFQRGAG